MKIYAYLLSAFLFAQTIKAQSCAALPVPFHEGFNGITQPFQWPACWTSTTGTLFSFTGPDPYAGCLASGDNYYNSPEFILSAGYNYSVSMTFWQSTDNKIWNKVALHLVKGSNQNLGIVASGTDFTTADSIIGGTFSVAMTGTYHIGVQTLKVAAFPPPGTMSYFDDLRIGCANNMTINSQAGICLGENTEIFGSGATSYTIISPTSVVEGMPFYDSPLSDITYTVLGRIYGNCNDTRTVFVKVSECTGIEENTLSVGLHPNPFHDRITLETLSGTGRVTIFDQLGNLLYTTSMTGQRIDIHLENFLPGVYLLRYEDNGRSTIKKMVRQ